MDREQWARVKEIVAAALLQPASARTRFIATECDRDNGLRGEVESLLAAAIDAAPLYEDPELSIDGRGIGRETVSDLLARASSDAGNALPPEGATLVGRRIGRYRIERAIGEGGMGAVYLAERDDQEYRQQVALKIARAVASPSLLRRFRDERQILASLDHPNIARLLDGGTTDDGVPYLVMELVEGAPIDGYCEQRRLSLVDRLRLFRQVCEAVQYAHQRLVIHRDLKPANILVQHDGVPKLLDFGIAKLLDQAPGTATTLLHPLTPEYASPEQVRGETITTASDVYSLGVLLYHLLVGRSPYSTDSQGAFALVRAVCETDSDKPSNAVRSAPLSRRLAGDLDNIVLKALRKEPEQRYRSVEQLSEDIRRHLEGLPVIATRGSWRYRAGKFITRHKVGVAASVVVLLAVLAGTATAAWQARIARMQADIAQAERTRAERRFNDVRALANSMIFELHDSIQDVPGTTAARKLILERALTYLDRLGQESRGDPSLQRELADAYKRIGDVQGGPLAANAGDTAQALASYEKSATIRQALLASNPGQLSDLIGFAEISRLTANALTVSGNTSAALDHARRAVHALEAARSSHPRSTELLEELMRDYGAEANIHASFLINSSLGDVSAALPLRRKQLEIAELLSDTKPNDAETRRTLAAALSSMGDQLLLTGERKQATAYLTRAQQLLATLAGISTPSAALAAGSTKLLFDLHDGYYRLVPIQLADGQSGLAEASARRAIEIGQQLVAADPQNTQAQVVLAADFANFADVVSRAGKHGEADAAFMRAMRIDAELVRKYPATEEFRRIRPQRLLIGGDVSSRRGDAAQAIRYYEQAIDGMREKATADPRSAGLDPRLGFAFNGMGSAYLRLNKLQSASHAYQQTLSELSAVLGSDVHGDDEIYAVADAYAGLGAVEATRASATSNRTMRSSLLRQALSWYDRSLELWARVKEPGLVSPGGYNCVPLRQVKNRRAQIAADLSSAASDKVRP